MISNIPCGDYDDRQELSADMPCLFHKIDTDYTEYLGEGDVIEVYEDNDCQIVSVVKFEDESILVESNGMEYPVGVNEIREFSDDV